MPRNHSRSSARPASRPVQTAPPRREAHTAAAAAPTPMTNMAPVPTAAPVYAPQAQPGILGQIATTAAGVATGHVIGRMVTGLFSGNGSEGATMVASPEPASNQTRNSTAPQCQEYSKLFLQCMDQNGHQVSTCQDYLEMMKACQQQYA